MKHLFALFVLLFSSCIIHAQGFCKPTSIFFDLNKSELNPAGKMLIDSLVESVEAPDFILEIYGYTDTSNTDNYNRKLSQNRINAVLGYLKKQQVSPKEIRSFNEGEDFTSSNLNKNAAFQRRVDLYITPMDGSDVVFKSPEGIVVKRNLASFGDCGICALRPEIKYQWAKTEVNQAGEKLTMYGMILFDVDTCPSVLKEEQNNLKMDLESYTINWDDRSALNGLANESRIQTPDRTYWDSVHKVLRLYTVFRRRSCEIDVIDDKRVPKLVLPEESLKGRSFYIYGQPSSVQRLLNDTTLLKSSVSEVVSYFPVGTDWYLFRDKAWKIIHSFLNRDSVSPDICLVTVPDYRVVSPTGEITLKVKLKGIEKIGYYNKEFDLLIEMEHVSAKTYSGQMYRDGFELCYVKKGRYYLERNKAKRLKIKAKNGRSKATLKQSYLLKKNQLKWRLLKDRGFN